MTAAPSRLRTDAQVDPCGLAVQAPLLSWVCGDERPAEVQSGFQIQAASSREGLELRPDLWDTGTVDGDAAGGVVYEGRDVRARARVWWRVRTFDSDGMPSEWSDPAHFEFSILPEDWSAAWIAPAVHGSRQQSPVVPLLRRRFRVGFAPTRARLYLAVAGSCRVWINERELDVTEVPSGLVDYSRRIGFRAINVDGLVRPGANSITVLLGDGWFSGFADGHTREHFGNRPELRVQLELDGSTTESLRILSDAQWEWRPSPLLHADLSLGSAIDGRAFSHDPEYARQKRLWLPVDVIERPARTLIPMTGPGVVAGPSITGRIERRSDLDSGERRWWVHFPGSVTGRVALTLQGRSGQYLRLRYTLDDTIADPAVAAPRFDERVIDTYTLSGDEPRESITPPFARRAFRTVEICGDIDSRGLLVAEAVPLGLSAANTLGLACDHPLVERLVARLSRTMDLLCQEVIWSGTGVDERRVSLADLYPVIGTLASVRDLTAHFRGWIDEVLASEADPAGLPSALPPLRTLPPGSGISAAETGLATLGDISGGSETVIRLALELFRQQGDRRVLAKVFPFARRLIYALERTFPDLIRPVQGVPGLEEPLEARIAGTAMWHECIGDTARIAELLELKAQAESLRQLADRVRAAFQSHFVTPSGLLVPDTVAAYVAALSFGMLDEDSATQAFEHLCDRVVRGGYRAQTPAMFGTRLLDVLLAGSRDDLAWAVALRLDAGTWLGDALDSTDLMRDADGRVGLGRAALVGWLVSSAIGFSPDISLHGEGAAWRRVNIAPRLPVGELFPEGPPLRLLAATLHTVAGLWRVEWRISARSIVLQCRVPAGCAANVLLPDGTRTRIVAGEHSFRMDLHGGDDRIPILSETL